jgi:hypothetical protein
MRGSVAGIVLSVAVLLPKVGNAQVSTFRTPAPEVTAATASWQVNSEPIMIGGLIFYPTREHRAFDGQLMAQVGVYEGVPIFADATMEPWSLVYVPIGRERMRTFERARTGELAGTSGSRSPSFATMPSITAEAVTPVNPGPPSIATQRPVGTAGSPAGTVGSPVATAGSIVPRPADTETTAANIPERSRVTRTRLETIPRSIAATSGGVWLDFNGARWYSAGSAVPYVADRFTPVGTYRGFRVYRANSGNRDRIWVSVVPDGPVAPYDKR